MSIIQTSFELSNHSAPQDVCPPWSFSPIFMFNIRRNYGEKDCPMRTPTFFFFFFHIQSSKLLTSKFFRSFLKFRMLMASQSQILISMVVLSPPKHFLISCNMSTVLNDGCKSFSTCHFIYKRILRGGRNPETLVLVITCNCSLIFL